MIDVDNEDLALRPGMTANVTFVLDQVENAIKIPNAALRFKPSRDQMHGAGREVRRQPRPARLGAVAAAAAGSAAAGGGGAMAGAADGAAAAVRGRWPRRRR